MYNGGAAEPERHCQERGAEDDARVMQASSFGDAVDSSSIHDTRSSSESLDSDPGIVCKMRPEFEALLVGLKGRS